MIGMDSKFPFTRSRHAGHQYVPHPTSEYDEPCWVWQATSLRNDDGFFLAIDGQEGDQKEGMGVW